MFQVLYRITGIIAAKDSDLNSQIYTVKNSRSKPTPLKLPNDLTQYIFPTLRKSSCSQIMSVIPAAFIPTKVIWIAIHFML